MEKEQIKPMTERISVVQQVALLEGSDKTHADGKQHNFFEDEDPDDESWIKNQYNIWEE